MEFKQWLNEEAVWNLSKLAKQGNRPETPGLFQRAANGWLQGIHNVQQKRLWGNEPGGGPHAPTPKFPTIGSIKQAFQTAEDEAPVTFPMPWEEAKKTGFATVSPPQTSPNNSNAISQAFETYVQSLSKQNYTPEMQQIIRTIGYSKFLNPARPQADATGNITFEFVIPKPEKIT